MSLNVLVLQAENREVDYLGLTKRINPIMCDYLSKNTKNNYFFSFINMGLFCDYDESIELRSLPLKEGETNKMLLSDDLLEFTKINKIHPATAKLFLMNWLLSRCQSVNEDISLFLQNGENKKEFDFIVFLDSDAWIQTPDYLNTLIETLSNDETKNGAFSRDPYLSRNTYINSGSYVIKNNNFIRNMFCELIETIKEDKSHLAVWAYDQYYISGWVFKNRDLFHVFKPNVLNTPCGFILRHNWFKTYKLYRDLYELLDASYVIREPQIPFHYEEFIDREDFPNVMTYAYEWNEP